MPRLVLLFALFFSLSPLSSQTFYNNPLVHTYSIVAIDTATGEIGAAVQSHWFSVGSIVIWAESGVGAVATQSLVNTSFGPRGLALMKQGISPAAAGKLMLNEDEGRGYRQLALIDTEGNTFAHTGKDCIPAAGHVNRKNYSIQANLMLKNTVWGAMEKAFLETKGPLAERMVAAMVAAEEEGGDIRGKQSAALLVVRGESTGNIWEDRLIDLRIEDHPEPVKEMQRLLKVHRAYGHMNAGDVAIEHNNVDDALREYGAAQEMFPGNLEMQYWTAVSLANAKRLDEAIPMFKKIFKKDNNWKILTPRLIDNNLLNVSKDELDKILN